MGVGIIANHDGAVLYCNTTMQAFGPVMDNEMEAADFLEWLGQDARTLSDKELIQKYDEYSTLDTVLRDD